MLATRDSQGNPRYQIWFDYTRNLVNEIREGDLVAIQNFAPIEDGVPYSVLSLTNVLPIHYALGKTEEDLKGYPGHVMEAAKNIAKDWKDQVDEPTEDVTKIVCEAVPTFLEFVDVPKGGVTDKPIQEETAIPMPGEEAKLLGRSMVSRIVNLGIDREKENVISVGSLLRDDQIEVLLKVEDFIKVHFGIFGFTGVGKSNLLSTLIDRTLSSRETTKIVLLDVMDEYKGILFDLFLRNEIFSELIILDVESLPGPVFDYINGGYQKGIEELAVRSFLDTLLLPRSLKSKTLLDAMRERTPEVLKKIRIVVESRTVAELRSDLEAELLKGSISPETRNAIRGALDRIFGAEGDATLTPSKARELLNKHFPSGIGGVKPELKGTALTRIEAVEAELKRIAGSPEVKISDKLKTDIGSVISDLNDRRNPSLYVVSAFQPEAVLGFSAALAWSLFGTRRVRALTEPLVSFVADEGDLFIPASAEKESETARAKAAIEMLSRRGRKFGIGVGIATQRVAYLDTKTMGQLHTYFVSKLPRSYDRDAVSAAFGLSETQFAPTFKFRSGEWLLVSHDATGLKGVPIPIRAPNAEDRIRASLKIAKMVKD